MNDVDIDIDYDDMGKSQKENILSTLFRQETDYQHGARRYSKDRIASLRSAHQDDYRSIVEYIDAMQRFDTTFTNIKRKEGVEDIAEILETIDVYEEKFREKSKDLGFLENEIIGVQKLIISGKEELFSNLHLTSLKIEEERIKGRDSDPKIQEIIEQRSHE